MTDRATVTQRKGWEPPKTRTERERDVVRQAASLGDVAGIAGEEELRRMVSELGAAAREITLTVWCQDCLLFPVSTNPHEVGSGLCDGCWDNREEHRAMDAAQAWGGF